MWTGGDNGDNYRGYYYAIINVLATGAFFVPTLSLPGECSFVDSYQTGPLKPNIGVLMTCAFVYGYFDATVNTVLTTMIGLSFTNELDASGFWLIHSNRSLTFFWLFRHLQHCPVSCRRRRLLLL